jgi:hypothetical protein
MECQIDQAFKISLLVF